MIRASAYRPSGEPVKSAWAVCKSRLIPAQAAAGTPMDEPPRLTECELLQWTGYSRQSVDPTRADNPLLALPHYIVIGAQVGIH